jgi:hypothetical protein
VVKKAETLHLSGKGWLVQMGEQEKVNDGAFV